MLVPPIGSTRMACGGSEITPLAHVPGSIHLDAAENLARFVVELDARLIHFGEEAIDLSKGRMGAPLEIHQAVVELRGRAQDVAGVA